MKIVRHAGISLAACLMAVVLPVLPALAGDDDEDKPLTTEEVLEYLKANVPEAIDVLKETQKEEAGKYAGEIKDWSDRIKDLREIREKAPDIAETLTRADRIEVQADLLAGEIGEAKDQKTREAKIVKLREMLNTVFEARLKEKEFEKRRLEKEITEINQMMERRQSSRKDIIERHLQDMVGGRDEALEWW